jgi:hypothetical protein
MPIRARARSPCATAVTTRIAEVGRRRLRQSARPMQVVVPHGNGHSSRESLVISADRPRMYPRRAHVAPPCRRPSVLERPRAVVRRGAASEPAAGSGRPPHPLVGSPRAQRRPRRPVIRPTRPADPGAPVIDMRCPGCGSGAGPATGPTHPYIGASPGCWAQFTEVMISDLGGVVSGQLLGDAYAVQHPGINERRARQSVAVHLIALPATLERSWPADRDRRPAPSGARLPAR